MIQLPVSIGEAIDKLTILDIKLQKIKDVEKRAYCQAEYTLLESELKPYIEKHQFYYTCLRNVNLRIWEMQDEIRNHPDAQKCVEILDTNDMRFRLKDVINKNTNSQIREQKGYPVRKAIVLSHLGLGDHIGLIGAIRSIAMGYDETVVVCKHNNLKNCRSFFEDNPSITFFPIDESQIYYTKNSPVAKITGLDMRGFHGVYMSGAYLYPNHGFSDLPKCFYRDMNLDPDIRHTHFYMPTTVRAKELYDMVSDQPYIFVQQKSSSHFTDLITWDTNSVLTIDPNINVYPKDHVWHDLAEAFVNQDFIDYTLTIQHAKEIHTIDSSFYCLACYIPLDASVKKCYARETGTFISTYDFT